jgi:uncharacterized YigZ family protein
MSFSLAQAAHHELVIKKSRFIACVEPVAGREAALTRVTQLKAEHPDAAHVCWALLAGGQSAANDDGEPGGTAGRPMLEVLRHHDLQGVMASVVRYFGGVKLGAGGLVRAYTDAVAQALLTAEKIALIQQVRLVCSVPYALEGWVRRELDLAKAQLLVVSHGSEVSMLFALPETGAAALAERLSEGGRGQLQWLDAKEFAETHKDNAPHA